MRQRQPERPGRSAQRRAAERLYALLLLLYPPAHRRAFGPLMLQTFTDSYRDALATQRRLGPGFWLGVAGDEAKSLVREHGTALRGEVLRMKRWGVEIAAGGLLVGSVVISVARCVHR
jgi:hypothetical protein